MKPSTIICAFIFCVAVVSTSLVMAQTSQEQEYRVREQQLLEQNQVKFAKAILNAKTYLIPATPEVGTAVLKVVSDSTATAKLATTNQKQPVSPPPVQAGISGCFITQLYPGKFYFSCPTNPIGQITEAGYLVAEFTFQNQPQMTEVYDAPFGLPANLAMPLPVSTSDEGTFFFNGYRTARFVYMTKSFKTYSLSTKWHARLGFEFGGTPSIGGSEVDGMTVRVKVNSPVDLDSSRMSALAGWWQEVPISGIEGQWVSVHLPADLEWPDGRMPLTLRQTDNTSVTIFVDIQKPRNVYGQN